MTREEAVRYLKLLGFAASPRDWALGKTIAVYLHPQPPPFPMEPKIQAWKKVIYIVPDGRSGTWILDDQSKPGQQIYGLSLQAACDMVIINEVL